MLTLEDLVLQHRGPIELLKSRAGIYHVNERKRSIR